MTKRRIHFAALTALLSGALVLPGSAATLCGRCIDTGSGDGADLAIGVPGEDRGAIANAGVAYLLVDGATTTPLGQNLPLGAGNINGNPQSGDRFASSMAAGDFNGDGWDDLAIGVPHEDVKGVTDAGLVVVLLSDAGTGALAVSQVIHQGTPGFPGALETGDRFGWSLSSQDFGFDDGYDDLIVGVPFEDVGSIADAGIVQVVHGSATGLDPTNVESWNQNTPGVRGHAEAGDRWGYVVAGSPVGDESWGTLIVSAPYEDLGSITDAGLVQVIYSTSAGLNADNDQIFHQNTPGIRGRAETGDRFGMSLAIGDFGSGYFDLAVGVPHEDWGSFNDTGIVHIINGDFNGLVTTDNSILKQGSGQLGGFREGNDRFGETLASVPYEGEFLLAIGTPGENLGHSVNAGLIELVFPLAEEAEGLTRIHQNVAGVADTNEAHDDFGAAIDFSDVNNDGISDLVVGGPGENNDAGQVWVFYGSADGFSSNGTTYQQGDETFPGSPESGDRFGAVLTGSRR